MQRRVFSGEAAQFKHKIYLGKLNTCVLICALQPLKDYKQDFETRRRLYNGFDPPQKTAQLFSWSFILKLFLWGSVHGTWVPEGLMRAGV